MSNSTTTSPRWRAPQQPPTSPTRAVLAALALAVSVAGCADARRQMEFNARMDGQPADPDEYDVTDLTCTNDGTVVITATLTSTSDIERQYTVMFRAVTLDGELYEDRRLPPPIAAGASMQIETTLPRSGDQFPTQPDCSVEILDSPLEVLG